MTTTLRMAIAVSGAGHVLHNGEEFGFGAAFVSQTLLPAAITMLLLVKAHDPTRRVLQVCAVWALVVIVLGGGTVFPLPILPFVPAQTVSHYVAHAAYALLQLPLLMTALGGLESPGEQRTGPAAGS